MSSEVTPLTAGAIFVGLTTVVGVLARVLHTQYDTIEKRLTKKLDLSETKREEQSEKLLNVSTGLAELKGRLDGHQEAREDISSIADLSGDVLNWMHELHTRRKNKDGNSRIDNTD